MECRHSLISDVAVVAEGRVLLVRYADVAKYDDEPGWFLPDDVLRDLEHPTRTAKRIAKDQLGLELNEVRLDHIQSFRGNDGGWHMSFHHLSELPSVPVLSPSPDLTEAEWFPLDQLPPRAEVAHNGWALTILRKMALPAVR
jgi:ADP-ribose pyrophosphatase YjhB (NUDIX family)